jgi:hypothetical protein
LYSRRLEDENGVSLLDRVRRHLPLSRLQPLVGVVLKAHPSAVVRGRHLGVAHPPLNVVESEEAAAIWLLALLKIYIYVQFHVV